MTARRDLPLLLATLGALAARGFVLAAFSDHPLLEPDVGLDTGVYVDLARRVAGGDVLLRSVPVPFFVSPAYIYFAGLVLAVTGGSLLAVQGVQVILGALAVWLAGDTAGRLFGARAAFPAATLLGLTGVVAFHEAVLLQAALDPFLAALALWLLVRALDGAPRLRAFFAAGLALGVFALNRPNVLPWAAAAALFVLVARGLRSGWRLAFAFGLGAVLGIAPATVRNLVVSGEPVLVSSHGGLNFFVGNGPGADGTYRQVEGITPSIAGQAADAKKVAEKEEGRPLSAREVSAHFAGKVWRFIAAEPGVAARLFVRKLRYVLSGDEAPLNFSYPWYRRQSLALRLLAVGPGLLVPLGGAGLALAVFGAARLPRKDAAVWASFAPAYVLLVAAFFVATRYRLPLYVPLATAGGGALVLLFGAIRTREMRRLGIAAAVAVPLGAFSLWPTGLYDGGADEEMHWVLHLIDTGESDEASRRAEALAPSHPEPGTFWLRVGRAWGEAGRLDEAIPAFQRSLAADPNRPETQRLLAAAHEKRGLARTLAGDVAGAVPDLEVAVRLDPSSPSARLNLAAVLAERGERESARALANEALVLQPGYTKAEALLRALDGRK